MEETDHTGLAVNGLSSAQHLVLWMARAWFGGMVTAEPALPLIEKAAIMAGFGEAIDDIDEFFSMVASGAMQSYTVGCATCPNVHRIELDLVNAVSALQRGQWDNATWMLERHVRPDEAYMAGPPAFRWARTMKEAGWNVARIDPPDNSPAHPHSNVIPFPFRPSPSRRQP